MDIKTSILLVVTGVVAAALGIIAVVRPFRFFPVLVLLVRMNGIERRTLFDVIRWNAEKRGFPMPCVVLVRTNRVYSFLQIFFHERGEMFCDCCLY
jgi:hypothetical protein